MLMCVCKLVLWDCYKTTRQTRSLLYREKLGKDSKSETSWWFVFGIGSATLRKKQRPRRKHLGKNTERLSLSMNTTEKDQNLPES